MACRNLCERFDSRFTAGGSHYGNGKKYCRRCEVYFLHYGIFCPCCGMALRMSPTSKRDKETHSGVANNITNGDNAT
jgi:hypothetical protein